MCREKVEEAISNIIDRQYYTNHGPLTQKLEKFLEEYLHTKNALVITNLHIGLIVSIKVLGLQKINGVKIERDIYKALHWAGVGLDNRDQNYLVRVGLPLQDYLLSTNKAQLILGSMIEGAVIRTDNDNIAETIRNMRASYGSKKKVPIPLASYGRFSEVQAALCLIHFGESATL